MENKPLGADKSLRCWQVVGKIASKSESHLVRRLLSWERPVSYWWPL